MQNFFDKSCKHVKLKSFHKRRFDSVTIMETKYQHHFYKNNNKLNNMRK